jgi:thiamine pyrophosphate-dependent acetolactate synthase large subunit-like protein
MVTEVTNMREILIKNAMNGLMQKQANALELAESAANPLAKAFHGLGNVSSKHPLMTAGLLGALTAKFGPYVANKLINEANMGIQTLTNPYYNNYNY